MQEIIEKFNSFFKGSAKAEINNQNELKITIGSQTIIIELPSVVGGKCVGPERKTTD